MVDLPLAYSLLKVGLEGVRDNEVGTEVKDICELCPTRDGASSISPKD